VNTLATFERLAKAKRFDFTRTEIDGHFVVFGTIRSIPRSRMISCEADLIPLEGLSPRHVHLYVLPANDGRIHQTRIGAERIHAGKYPFPRSHDPPRVVASRCATMLPGRVGKVSGRNVNSLDRRNRTRFCRRIYRFASHPCRLRSVGW